MGAEELDFTEYVAARGPRLLRVAWLLSGGDSHAAEDLLQTTLSKVWTRWSRIRHEDPEGYVRRAMVNTALSWRRQRWRAELPEERLPERSSGDHQADVDLAQSLAAAVGRLPPKQRAVVVLRYFEDLSVEQTAALLGVRPGTVKSQAARALDTLRGHPDIAEGGGVVARR